MKLSINEFPGTTKVREGYIIKVNSDPGTDRWIISYKKPTYNDFQPWVRTTREAVPSYFQSLYRQLAQEHDGENFEGESDG